jgi:hypothetical protein
METIIKWLYFLENSKINQNLRIGRGLRRNEIVFGEVKHINIAKCISGKDRLVFATCKL